MFHGGFPPRPMEQCYLSLVRAAAGFIEQTTNTACARKAGIAPIFKGTITLYYTTKLLILQGFCVQSEKSPSAELAKGPVVSSLWNCGGRVALLEVKDLAFFVRCFAELTTLVERAHVHELEQHHGVAVVSLVLGAVAILDLVH